MFWTCYWYYFFKETKLNVRYRSSNWGSINKENLCWQVIAYLASKDQSIFIRKTFTIVNMLWGDIDNDQREKKIVSTTTKIVDVEWNELFLQRLSILGKHTTATRQTFWVFMTGSVTFIALYFVSRCFDILFYFIFLLEQKDQESSKRETQSVLRCHQKSKIKIIKKTKKISSKNLLTMANIFGLGKKGFSYPRAQLQKIF